MDNTETLMNIPFGKRLHNYEISQFPMDKPTINDQKHIWMVFFQPNLNTSFSGSAANINQTSDDLIPFLQGDLHWTLSAIPVSCRCHAKCSLINIKKAYQPNLGIQVSNFQWNDWLVLVCFHGALNLKIFVATDSPRDLSHRRTEVELIEVVMISIRFHGCLFSSKLTIWLFNIAMENPL